MGLSNSDWMDCIHDISKGHDHPLHIYHPVRQFFQHCMTGCSNRMFSILASSASEDFGDPASATPFEESMEGLEISLFFILICAYATVHGHLPDRFVSIHIQKHGRPRDMALVPRKNEASHAAKSAQLNPFIGRLSVEAILGWLSQLPFISN